MDSRRTEATQWANSAPVWPRADGATREATACEEFAESRIAAAAIPLGIDGEEDQVHVAHGVGPIQPLEHPVRVAEPGMRLCR